MTTQTAPDRRTTTAPAAARPRRRCPWWVPSLVLLATEAQLLVAEYVPGIDRFADKAFGARLVAYPVLMLVVPAGWWLVHRRRRRSGGPSDTPPYGAFTLVMLGFLVDVTGNSLDLYDTVGWWDDANHLVNWVFLLGGIGLLLAPSVRPRWVLALLVTGLGALLALAWELGEWFTFIRHGTELATAYEDTLADMALGTLGALVAGLAVASRGRRASTARPAQPAGSSTPSVARPAR
ncbi:hypothetical protein [Nocardioides litoris]|uniref:hypothetical protein n=1 Tax=Nocardioides litoris TaxID=1926648 RepID=UPI001B885353|nr:hypothetical protein [Nocardioides litoris]